MNSTNYNRGCCGGGNRGRFHDGCNRGRFHAGECHHAGCNRVGFYPGMFNRCECHNDSANIEFSSGVVPVVLTTLDGGLVGNPSIIGFGTAISGVISADGNIYSTGEVNEAYLVKRAGTLNAISASFTVTTPFDVVGQSATVTATIYRAPAGSDIFSPTSATVNLAPVLTSLLPVGTTLTGMASIFPPLAVAAGDRLLMVFTMSGSAGDLPATVTGTASASVRLSSGHIC